jgi:invasion protein IalB
MTKWILLTLSALLAQVGPVSAETKAPAAAAPSDPNFKSATYGDWSFHCQTVGAAAQARKSCEVVQTVNLKDQTAPFAQIALGKPTAGDPLMATVVVPINVSFPSAVTITNIDKEVKSIDLSWRRCVPGGCFASVPLKEETLKQWRSRNDASGKVNFKNAAGQDVVMPMSFKGLSSALEALAKE